MTKYNLIMLEHTNHISTITLDRPEKNNAFNAELIHELTVAINESQSADTRCILIKANGKHFCAGADLNWMRASKNHSVDDNKQDALTLAYLLQYIADSVKPTLSIIQGRAMGGACGLVAATDIAIAEKEAGFCFSEVRLGLIPATIAPYVLRRLGYQHTRRYFLTAELISATTAQHIQLIDHVVENSDQALELALTTAKNLRNNGPNALTAVKNLLNHLNSVSESTLDYTATLLADIRTSEEAQEGLSAFLDKRKPSWYFDDK